MGIGHKRSKHELKRELKAAQRAVWKAKAGTAANKKRKAVSRATERKVSGRLALSLVTLPHEPPEVRDEAA